MKFTGRTYRIAMQQQFDREYRAFQDHHAAFRGSREWQREVNFGRRLEARYRRERLSRRSRRGRRRA